jgi:hypothetical protein
VPQAPDNFGTGTPDADVAEPLIASVADVVVEIEDRSPQEIKQAEDSEDDLYSIKNFSI